MKTIALFVLLIFLVFRLSAQDSLNVDLDMMVEDASSQLGSDADVDWSNLTDILNDLKRNPINLNKATRQELQAIPFLSPILINNLFQHIRKNGSLLSIYELQAVEGFEKNVFEKIKPYITVTGQQLDMSDKNLHPKGPSFSQILDGGKGEIIHRMSRELENEKGYLLPDTVANRYLGSPWRSYSRIRYRYLQNVSISLLGEKDPGEQFKFQPEKKLYGYDFISGHIAVRNYGMLKSLVVGDFNIQFGQGLVLSRGLGFGKSGEVINTVKPQFSGILPYSSVNEVFFMRGAATQVAFQKFYVTVFGAYTPINASLSATLDTTDLEPETAQGLVTTGLHRTNSEFSKRRNLMETSFGGRVHYASRNLTIGVTAYYQTFSVPLEKEKLSIYQQFDFQGKTNFLSGLDWDWVHKNLNTFGEIAISQSGGKAINTGLLAALSPKVDFALNFRHFDKNFHSLKGFSFSERPYALQGETGVYFGLKILLHSKWQLSSYLDHYQFSWYRYLVNYPSQGWEWLSQINYKPKRGTQIYARFRIDQGQKNASSDEIPSGFLRYLATRRRQNLRLDYSTKLHRTLALHGRAEHSWYFQTNRFAQNGFLLFQDMVWDINYYFKITARVCYFDISSWDARIYAFENQVPTVFSIPALNGTGTRSYAILQITPLKNLDIWLRYSFTKYDRLRTIGSGLSEIQGNANSEFIAQIRWKF